MNGDNGDIESQVLPVFQALYKRYLVGEIGDLAEMTQLEKVAWAAALEELAVELRFLTMQQSMIG